MAARHHSVGALHSEVAQTSSASCATRGTSHSAGHHHHVRPRMLMAFRRADTHVAPLPRARPNGTSSAVSRASVLADSRSPVA
eukprot:4674602-Prymnesium_polylepis.1